MKEAYFSGLRLSISSIVTVQKRVFFMKVWERYDMELPMDLLRPLGWSECTNESTFTRKADNINVLSYTFPGLRTIWYGTGIGSMEASRLDWTGQQGWCSAQNGETLRVGDVNRDGLYDLLCHDTKGKTTLMFNQGGKGFVNVIFCDH